jgi:hypothetical protein
MIARQSYITKPRQGVRLNTAHPLAQGLLGYWIFNEGSGSRLNDISGNGNHGSLTNFGLTGPSSNWVGSKLGGCLNFDGVNDMVNVATSKGIIGSLRAFTIAAWVKFTDASASPIIYAEGNTSAVNPLYIMRIDTTGVLFGQTRGTSSSPLNIPKGTKVVNDGVWHHVAITVGSTGIINKMYVDGASDAFTGTNSAIAAQNTTNSKIGALVYASAPSGTAFFPGSIDEVRLYSRMLSESEIRALYTTPHIDLLGSSTRFFKPASVGHQFFFATG